MAEKWFKDGEELVHMNRFCVWCKQMENYFAGAVDYEGLPQLPDNWLEGLDIYDAADDGEKRMMLTMLQTKYLECLRHWKSVLDDLYGRQRQTFFGL